MQADEIVAIVETDKINVDIRSTHSGVITKYFANEGETVAVDSQFFEIDTDAKGSAAPAQAPAKQEAKTAETKKVLSMFNLSRPKRNRLPRPKPPRKKLPKLLPLLPSPRAPRRPLQSLDPELRPECP